MDTHAAVLWETEPNGASRTSSSTPPKAGRGAGQARRVRPVPLRRAPGHRRHGRCRPEIAELTRRPAVPDHRRPRGRRRGRRGRAGRDHAAARATTSSLSFIPACGRCPSCCGRAPATCATSARSCWPAARSATSPPGTTPTDGKDLGAHVLHRHVRARTRSSNEASCIKIDDWTSRSTRPRWSAAASPPGWGSAIYAGRRAARARPSWSSACGGIGMNAIQGAAMAGARHVVAVDPVEFKREQASRLRRHARRASLEEAAALVGELTWGANADKAILTTGVADGRPDRPDDGPGRQGRPGGRHRRSRR